MSERNSKRASWSFTGKWQNQSPQLYCVGPRRTEQRWCLVRPHQFDTRHHHHKRSRLTAHKVESTHRTAFVLLSSESPLFYARLSNHLSWWGRRTTKAAPIRRTSHDESENHVRYQMTTGVSDKSNSALVRKSGFETSTSRTIVRSMVLCVA